MSGEGLQHQDGTSQLIAATIPNCRAYDPAYAYELAVIMHFGMQRMMEQQVDEFYYLTVMNENYAHPTMPEGAQEGILKGLYRLGKRGEGDGQARLIGSGTILNEVIAAAELLAGEFGISTEIFSATSYCELARDARAVERENRLTGAMPAAQAHVTKTLTGSLPIIAATDYVRAVPQMIASYVDAKFIALGTDGFGRSDNRADLRAFFEVDRKNIALATVEALVRSGAEKPATLNKALGFFGLNAAAPAPWMV